MKKTTEHIQIFKFNIKEKLKENTFIYTFNSLKNKIEDNKLLSQNNNKIINIIKNGIFELKSKLEEKDKLLLKQKNQI